MPRRAEGDTRSSEFRDDLIELICLDCTSLLMEVDSTRGGLDRNRYAWGNELQPGGKWQANIWQGRFPVQNAVADNYARTSLVRAFPANGFGAKDPQYAKTVAEMKQLLREGHTR